MSQDSTIDKLTFRERLDLLTGYDEISIETKFGKDFDQLRVITRMRALIFVAKKNDPDNEGKDALKNAHKAALSMSIKEVNEFFGEDLDDDREKCESCGQPLPEDEDDPDAGSYFDADEAELSAAGKGDAPDF